MRTHFQESEMLQKQKTVTSQNKIRVPLRHYFTTTASLGIIKTRSYCAYISTFFFLTNESFMCMMLDAPVEARGVDLRYLLRVLS